MANVVDLRGRQVVPAPPAILADPSGRRARILARGGRAVAILFLLWLVGLALAGLGILPAGDVPLSHALAVGQGPPALKVPPTQSQPSAADLKPALPLSASAAAQRAVALAGSTPAALRALSQSALAAHHGHRPSSATHPGTTGGPSAGNGATGTLGATTLPTTGKPTAPGQTNQQSSPGHTKTSSPGKSGAAPGQVKPTTTSTSTTTAPGNSGTAHGNGRGHNGP